LIGSGELYVRTSSANKLYLGTNATNALTIDSSQRVGIGTTTPTNTDKLEIQTSSTSAPGLWVQTGGTTSAYPIAEFRTGSNLSALLIRGDGASVFTGKVLVGTSSARTNFFNTVATTSIQAEGITYQTASLGLVSTGNTTFDAGTIVLGKGRGASNGSNTIVQNGGTPDILGYISFQGNDGSEFVEGASIKAETDGTPGANVMPSKLVFSTNDGTANASPTERMRISSGGNVRMFAATGNGGLALALTDNSASGQDGITLAHSATGIAGSGTVSFRIVANGNVTNTNNSYGAISDVKLKENIVDATSQWDDLKALQVRKYNLKEGQTHTQIGLVAQEVELVSPGLVGESPDRDAEGNDLGTITKSVNYSVLYMKAVKALQEAMERIESLEASNADILTRLSALEAA